jgi:colanic acid/amylovoran biosynthesis glycosyltransferase
VICPRESAYSETFIQDHICRLPAQVSVLYGGRRPENEGQDPSSGKVLWRHLVSGSEFPNRTREGRPLIPLPLRLAEVALQRTRFSLGERFSEQALRSYLHQQGVQVVLAEFGQTGAKVAPACSQAGVPLVVHFHGADAFKSRWTAGYARQYQRMFSLGTAFVAVSSEMVEQLVSLGAPRERVFLNPCGVDTRDYRGADPAQAPPHFLYVGRFVEKKGPLLALLAFHRVSNDNPEATLEMIGDGPMLEASRQLVFGLHLQDAVQFSGVRSRAEVALAMQGARALVLHSVRTASGDTEGTPVSVLEAAATGLPVVATRHGGIPEAVVDGHTGFLVDEGDVDAMAIRMTELARSPQLAAVMGARGRQHIVEHYAMESQIGHLTEILMWALEGQGSR